MKLLFDVSFFYCVALIASVAYLALKMIVPWLEVIGEKAASSDIICFCLYFRFLNLRFMSSLDPELFRCLNVLCEFLFELNLLSTKTREFEFTLTSTIILGFVA